MAVHIIIPARYASSRFPGKLLAKLDGRPVLQWVYEAALQVPEAEAVWIAAADEQIARAVRAFGGRVFMSRGEHENGTERCAEAAKTLGLNGEIIVNLQGDEPFVRSRQISGLVQALQAGADIASLYHPIRQAGQLHDPNCVKVVLDVQGRALYFSRAPVPFPRDASGDGQHLPKGSYYKHLGMYAFAPGILAKAAALPATDLEQIEKLEQLRWLQHGLRIQMIESETDAPGIDTEADLLHAEQWLRQRRR